MDRDAGQSDRGDEARQGDTGMIGSEAEEPGPGRDTSLTDPDPVAAGTDQPRDTVAMSEGDPLRTRLGSHVEGAGAIGYDVAAAEEGTTQQTPPDDRPGYQPERSLGESTGTRAAATGAGVDDAGSTDRSVVSDEPRLAGYEGEPGDDQGVYDQEADQARRERPSEGL